MSVTPSVNFANGNHAHGYLVGTGAAISVSLGWIPRRVEVVNLTDGDKVSLGFCDKMIAFTSGGTVTPVANNTIVGNTSGARAKIKEVILVSGTYAAGDAAGYFVCDAEDVAGTFGSETVYNATQSAAAADDATVAVQVELGVDFDTEVASQTGNAGILSYVGSTTASKGFTIGSTISESAKLLRWDAFR